MKRQIRAGDCRDNLKGFPANYFNTIITDPPYGLEFMGQGWDKGVPGVPFWKEFLRVCKPGAIALVFGGTRTYHRLTCAIEDAGWVIRDCMMWLYGSGFPKSLDISKAIDKAKGANRKIIGEKITPDGKSMLDRVPNSTLEYHTSHNVMTSATRHNPYITAPATDLAKLWDGYGTALKPAWEPIIVAMKPLEGTYAQNAEKWGVAGLNIDGGRIGTESIKTHGKRDGTGNSLEWSKYQSPDSFKGETHQGRWPANLVLDEETGVLLDEQSGISKSDNRLRNLIKPKNMIKLQASKQVRRLGFADSGGASRFFYCAKASKRERGEGNNHPTVKPVALMEYLCRLTRPPQGEDVVLDPFAGSGTTGAACMNTGRGFVLIEKEPKYYEIIRQRLRAMV